jgi:hypothetical protein
VKAVGNENLKKCETILGTLNTKLRKGRVGKKFTTTKYDFQKMLRGRIILRVWRWW